MTHLLGMSFDAPASPSITLAGGSHIADLTSGWGFAWYPRQEHGVAIIKDPMPAGETTMTAVLRDWDRFRGTLFVCHVRGAAKRAAQEDTHPFTRSFAGSDWVMAHNGSLDVDRVRGLSLGANPVFEPVGRTDSERAFCWLLTQTRAHGARRLSGVAGPELHRWLGDLNALGTLNLLFSDGMDLVAYRDVHGHNALYYTRRVPPHTGAEYDSEALKLSLDDSRDEQRSFVLVASRPLSDAGWVEMQPGQMIVARRSVIAWDSAGHPDNRGQRGVGSPASPAPKLPAVQGAPTNPGSTAAQQQPLVKLDGGVMPRVSVQPAVAIEPVTRTLRVIHETRYRYSEEVERSTHLLRLRPVHDPYQTVLEHRVEIQPDVHGRQFEDVFGNHVTQLELTQPYSVFSLRSESLVRLEPLPPLVSPTRRTTIPLIWMPWQRQMMWPYLLPAELPETQLRELSDYAMSFVERQDYDLVETLLDINQTIHRDFEYVSGSTTLETTPFDVYTERRGVCQDFANLFACLARLLGVPARYRSGYILTGAQYDNTIQSEASHAWTEVYLPWSGWRGFDPTNGKLAGTDHIRVACGRNYRDATPTTGTIFRGGAQETLEVSVRVSAVSEQ